MESMGVVRVWLWECSAYTGVAEEGDRGAVLGPPT